ncbi:MAG: hypothetical protein ACYDCK_11885 [Thermoplasmatota archaeon]
MLRRRSAALLALAGSAVAVLVLAAPSLAQVPVHVKSGEFSNAECYSHHREEGFRSMDLFPDSVTQVAKDGTFRFHLTVADPWLHQLKNVEGYVNVSGAPGITFPGEKAPTHQVIDGSVAASPVAPTSDAKTFNVADNATEVNILFDGDAGAPVPSDWQFSLASANGKFTANSTGPAPTVGSPTTVHRALHIPYSNVSAGGQGAWKVLFRHGSSAQAATYRATVDVYYNLSRSTERLLKGPDLVPAHGQTTFTFDLVVGNKTGPVKLVYGAVLDAYNKHTDPNAMDDGIYDKWGTIEFTIGDTTQVGNIGTQVFVAKDPAPVERAWGQIVGFAASFLMIPSLVLGGVFGRSTVTGLNALMGAARRRVLWHNAASFVLLGAVILHLLLFLAESFWPWAHGILWGGLALAAIIGLGFSGAMQRRLVAHWGFERWRFTHYTLGVLVVVFMLVHLAADGTHFQFVRDWFNGKF